MHYIINAVTCIIMNYLIIENYRCFPQCFGGSFVYILLYGYLFYVTVCYKKYQKEISFLMIVCLIMLWYNKIVYYEINDSSRINITFYNIYVLIFLLALWTSLMARLPFRYPKLDRSLLKQRQIDMIKSILLRFSMVILCVLPVWTTGMNLKKSPVYLSCLQAKFTMSFVAILFLILFISIQMRIMAKIPARNYSYALAGVEKSKLPLVKKYFRYGFTVLFLIGSVMEIMRGFWFFWLGTAVLSLLLAASLWNVWKYVLDDDSDAGRSTDLPMPLNDGVFVVKVMGILFISVILYDDILMALL